MRDIERIDYLLELLGDIWKDYQDVRFNQLIYLLHSKYIDINGGIGRVESDDGINMPMTGYDLFNIADDKFISFLEDIKKSGL
ncbi:hypothetical protein [Photobacterium kishitanii]|uniref:Uncharacterized protein n=1 Tax=Photobacterium kishitanii TaxID=318456 RepID=A0A2T3KK75_9GAMM|nr:hypothetical protein [Photobacterium kishitanii]PSU99910.1 hypothetical protein C9J27_06585 [Photobacterium kishitanii]